MEEFSEVLIDVQKEYKRSNKHEAKGHKLCKRVW